MIKKVKAIKPLTCDTTSQDNLARVSDAGAIIRQSNRDAVERILEGVRNKQPDKSHYCVYFDDDQDCLRVMTMGPDGQNTMPWDTFKKPQGDEVGCVFSYHSRAQATGMDPKKIQEEGGHVVMTGGDCVTPALAQQGIHLEKVDNSKHDFT